MIQEVYRSKTIRLEGGVKGKPHVVNGQRLKYYFAGQKFVGNIEEVTLVPMEKVTEHKLTSPEFIKSTFGNCLGNS
jgi:hypothetical protein